MRPTGTGVGRNSRKKRSDGGMGGWTPEDRFGKVIGRKKLGDRANVSGAQCLAGWGTGEGFRFPGLKIGGLGLPRWVLGRSGAGEWEGQSWCRGGHGSREGPGSERAVIPKPRGHGVRGRWCLAWGPPHSPLPGLGPGRVDGSSRAGRRWWRPRLPRGAAAEAAKAAGGALKPGRR